MLKKNKPPKHKCIIENISGIQHIELEHECRCILHVGRLGSYQYLNIDMTMYEVKAAIEQLLPYNYKK